MNRNQTGKSLILSEQDRLLLHQLRILEWLDASRGESRQDALATGEAQISDGLPSRWNLVGDLKLYEWQEDCIGRWLGAEHRGTVKVVTGGGKTLLALAIAQRLQNTIAPKLRVAVVVPTIVLMHQWHGELISRSNLPERAIGRLGGDYSDDFSGDKRVLLAVLASAHKKLPGIVSEAGIGDNLLLIADECHRAGAAEMSRVFQCERRYSLGLSATPERGDDEDEDSGADYNDSLLGKELGPIIYDFTLADALRLGVVPSFTIHHYGLSLSPEEKTKYESISRAIKDTKAELRDFSSGGHSSAGFFKWVRKTTRDTGEMGNLARRLVADTTVRKSLLYGAQAREASVEELLRKEFAANPDCRAILFHESIEQVNRLFVRLKVAGFPVIAEHSQLPDSVREAGLDLFRRGIAQVIVSPRTLIEGFNVPAVDVGIIVASSSSPRQRIQSLGRVLRKHLRPDGEDKTSCIHVLYCRETVDEIIYELADWDKVTGIENNLYYHWTPGTEPVVQPGPPRRPLPPDDQVDPKDLKPAGIYPGQYEGMELTCDTQGNIRNGDGHYASNAGDLPERIRQVKGSMGMFRVTPRRGYVLVRASDGSEWYTLFVTTLTESLKFSSDQGQDEADETAILEWVQKAQPGDPYPYTTLPVRVNEVTLRAKRGGVIAMRVPRGEVFARVGSQAIDSVKGRDAQHVLAAAEIIRARGGQVTKVEINSRNHILYRTEGQLRFLCALESGLEFPEESAVT